MEFTELARVVMDTWRQLTPADRAPYEAGGGAGGRCSTRACATCFLELQHEYKALYQDANQTGRALTPPVSVTPMRPESPLRRCS